MICCLIYAFLFFSELRWRLYEYFEEPDEMFNMVDEKAEAFSVLVSILLFIVPATLDYGLGTILS